MKELIKELQKVAERCDLDDNYDINDAAEDVREIVGGLEKISMAGNAAKMRKMLETVRDWLERMNKVWLDALATSQITPAFAVNRQAKSLIRDNEYYIGMIASALAEPPRNCDAFSKAEVLEVLDNRSFSKEDTIEWLYAAEGEI